nr:ribonuclease H-like domain-containing protein [Tanacetum cinerariifolium]
MANEGEDHALVADAEAPTEFTLMANTKSKLETLKLEKDGVDGKLAGLLKASKNLDNLIESQRSDKVKDGVGYNAVPPPAADLYLSPKKDLSWTGLPEFVDDTVTDYSRPMPTIESTSEEGQNKNSSTSEDVASLITPKLFVKFVKPKDTQSEKNKKETPKKSQVKYAEQYRHSNKKPNVKGNQRNWNNLKSYQLGPEFVLKKKACFNCGDFSHLANDCRKRVQRKTTRSQNHAYMSPSHRSAGRRPHGAPMRLPYRSAGHRPHGAPMRPSHRPHGPSMNPMRPKMNGPRPNRSFFIQVHSYETRPFLKTSAVKTQYRAPWVPTVNRNNPPINRKFSTGKRNFPTANRKFPTASRKFPTGSTKIHTADMGRKGKAVKPSACWIWKPSHNLSNKGLNNNSVSVIFKKYTYIDTQGRLNGCSRHMTGNISYLSDFEPFDGGYVSFGQGGCKITGKGTIKTGTKVDASKDEKKDVSSLRYIVLPNWGHAEHLESTSSQPQDILRDTSNSEESNGMEADVSYMETTITASPTPTLKIHRDHPKSQIIGPVDTPIQTRNKSKEELETLKEEKDVVDGKLARLLKFSKDLENLIESQRSNKIKDEVGYNAVPPAAADLYLSPKKDLSWTGLPEFVNDTVTDYSRSSPTVEIDRPTEWPTTNKAKTMKKPTVKYEKMYRRPSKKPTVRGNQRNWTNLKTQQLGPDFPMKKKACYNCGDFSHLANYCRKKVQRETTRSQNHAYVSPSHRSASHRSYGAPMGPPYRSAGHRPHGAPMRPSHKPAGH